jgi:hypothetical protein
MDLVFGILRGTPWWVYLVFALLVRLGLRASRDRVISLFQVPIAAGIFIIWGGLRLLSHGAAASVLVPWLGGAVAGVALGLLSTRLPGLLADRQNRLVHLPGSWRPLVRNLVVFSARYALGVAGALQSGSATSLALWDAGVAGASAGYFLGWLIRFVIAYRAAPEHDLRSASGRAATSETG